MELGCTTLSKYGYDHQLGNSSNLFVPEFCFAFFFWLRWVFIAARGLSLVVASRGCSSLRCTDFSLWWLLLLRSMGSRHTGFSSCSLWALERGLSSCGTWAQQLWLVGSRGQAQYLKRTGLAAPQHAGSSRTRARTRIPCIGRRVLNHCATGEVPVPEFLQSLTCSSSLPQPRGQWVVLKVSTL